MQVDSLFQEKWVMIALTALAIIVATAIVSWLVTRFLKHILMREDSVLSSSSIFLNIARAVVWILGVCVILDACFGINVTAVIAALGVGGIALSLGLQDTIANLVGGLQVSLTKLIQPGDKIQVGTDSGVITDITWRHVTLLNDKGETVVIPNASINKAALIKLKDEQGSKAKR
ncbi:MAG: mechanosensitive ion channel family protein [Eggerthellaceae bacterium]|jgi:small-conductance mechanosensitive channel|nr:mechanosensitive ion channel family protein [Eggerthellaceae bacterium]MDR2715593.1 mechanosensitive ion channel family protein [Coriobacteriaceae bacterium]